MSEIYAEVDAYRSLSPNLDAFRQAWKVHLSQVGSRVPGVHIEAEGESVYLGELSPGCRACKEGTWDCAFTTMRCNLDCAFCYSPHAVPENYAGSAFGSTPEQIAANHAITHITGISFSGGEPFMDAHGLFAWAAWFQDHCPDKYYWVYTNGLLAHTENVQRLGELGIDEIRFNMAATGYDHPVVMANLAAAARFIPNVTVEIPAIPDHETKLLSCLADWCMSGVRYLNLHELMYEPDTNSASMSGVRQDVITNDGHHSAVNPASRALTLTVMQYVQEHDLRLSVNDCSLQSKLRQLRGRRRSLAPLTRSAQEKLLDGEFFASCCAWRDGEILFFHPDSFAQMRQQYPDDRFARLVRTAPLSIQDKGRWIAFEEMVNESAKG
ncbi:MAG: radical SAM protein [Anaerolineae bacterium]|nr:radical SAM protein [Anaerolineae bacterium]